MEVKTSTRNAVVIPALIFIFIFCKANSCERKPRCAEGSHKTIPIVNNSNISINWTEEDSRDSVWTINGQVPPIDDGLLAPGETVNIGASRDACWEESFAPGGYQYYFLFSHDTVVAIGWDKISGTNRGLLKKIKVDLDYLKKNKYSITFP